MAKVERKRKKSSAGNPPALAVLLCESGLPIEQEKGATLLAMGVSVAEVGRELNLDRRTIYSWLKSPRFCAYYKGLLRDVRREIRGQLSNMAACAAKTLQELLDGGGEQARLKAATYILDRLADDEKLIKKQQVKKYGKK